MDSRLLVTLVSGLLVFNMCAEGAGTFEDAPSPQEVNVECKHDSEAIKQLIAYKHYNQERRNVLAEYDADCIEYNPAMQKQCMKLIKAYDEIRKEIEKDTEFVYTGFLTGKDVPRYKCYDLVGKRGKSMAMWKKKAVAHR